MFLKIVTCSKEMSNVPLTLYENFKDLTIIIANISIVAYEKKKNNEKKRNTIENSHNAQING